ncbi:MAG: YkgJ family cysteine cluster protein [Proteobacteria bacterium]|nr:YkgJ family cysteine cluster protein [Pseudomonadota bacterium]MBU1687357.1 YkgJ family cysteine cluster protein [Pseudomonadota bacterium]
MNLCVLCAQRGNACCVNRDILVTSADQERIAAHVGESTFFEYRKPASPAYLDNDDDPNWNSMTVQVNGARLVLKRGMTKRCYFLTGRGCRLPAAVRPLICRLHPVEYTETGITGLSGECPIELLAPPTSLLENLGMSLDQAESWRSQLYEELRQDFKKREKVA